jgi:tetratricopeptide (TPR) repeat protein
MSKKTVSGQPASRPQKPAAGKTAKPSGDKSRPYKNYIAAAILLLTVIVYAPSLKNDFVAGDDYTIVADNADIRSLENIPKFFTQPYHAMYCPVKMISHAVDYLFSAARPGGYHFFSLLYHLINVLLLFSLIRLLFSNTWAAAAGALLFAVHPINAETVCWLTGRGDLLYAGFYFGGLIAYVKYIQSGCRQKYFAFTLMLFILSGLSKASAMTFPLTLAVLDWFYRRKLFSWRVAMEKAPFFLGALALGLSSIALRSGHSVPLSEYFTHFTGMDSFVIFIYPLTFYLVKFFVPLKLALPYPHPFASSLPLSPDFYIYPLILAALAVAAWRCRNIRRPLLFALLFYLTGLVSAMRLTPMLGTIAADRYFYAAMAGVVLFIAWLSGYLSQHRALWHRRAFPLFLTVFVLFAVTMAAMTRARAPVFKNAITLFGDAHNKYPAHATPLYELTGGYMQAGDWEKAMQTAEKIRQLLPDSEDALAFQTDLFLAVRQQDKALDNVNRMIRISPKREYYFLKASLHRELRQPDSVLATASALMQYPGEKDLYVSAGRMAIDCRIEEKQYDEALALMDTVVSRYPEEAVSFLAERARMAFETGDPDAALAHLLRLLELQPENAAACENIGKIYAMSGDLSEACKYWKKAAALHAPEAEELLKNCP